MLTLLKAFRRAVFSNDNPGGQIQGNHTFRYDVIPFSGDVPATRLFLLGQRVNGAVLTVDHLSVELEHATGVGELPSSDSYLSVEGDLWSLPPNSPQMD